MKLINTDGMAFIGPGSEWFWTAVSGIVLAVTFLPSTASSGSNGAQVLSSRSRHLRGNGTLSGCSCTDALY